MTNIKPKMPGLKSAPTAAPGPKPIVKRWSGDYTKEEREQILGKKYSGEPLGPTPKSEPSDDFEKEITDSSIDEFVTRLMASPLTQIVKRAILKNSLPKSTSLVMLSSNNATAIDKIEFARVASSVLDKYLDVDARVCRKEDEIQIHCSGLGSEMVMAGAIQSVCDMVTNEIKAQAGARIYATAIAGGVSTFDEVKSSTLVKNCKQFNMRRVANGR